MLGKDACHTSEYTKAAHDSGPGHNNGHDNHSEIEVTPATQKQGEFTKAAEIAQETQNSRFNKCGWDTRMTTRQNKQKQKKDDYSVWINDLNAIARITKFLEENAWV